VLVVLYQSFEQGWHRRRMPPNVVELLCLFLAAALVMTPLAAYAVVHWDAFAERSAQVSVFNPAIGGDRPWTLLSGNLFRAAGLFFVRGDRIPRHNIPHRPLYDPLAGVFFLMGVLLCIGRALVGIKGRAITGNRTSQVGPVDSGTEGGNAHALALIWTGVMLIPTILAEDCPHFLRAVGVLPMAAVFPALGLEWAREQLDVRERVPSWIGQLLVALVLGISATGGLYDYFVRHARNPELRYAFEADQVQEAIEINRFLGTGWQGEGMVETPGKPIGDRRVYLHPRMWEDRFSVNLLVGSPEKLSILGRPAPDAPAEDEVLVLAWPFEDLRQVQEVLPHPAEIAVWPGPLERGDLDAEPRLLYVAYRARALDAPSTAETAAAVVRFEEGIELLDWQIEPAGEGLTRVRLRWRATEPLSTDYTVFVHIVRGASERGALESGVSESGQPVAQSDGAPGAGHYATRLWRPGDEILDEHVVSASYDPQQDRIVVGWYEWSSMRHLHIIWEKDGEPGADRYTVRSPAR
jgi:hypothetical protein